MATLKEIRRSPLIALPAELNIEIFALLVRQRQPLLHLFLVDKQFHDFLKIDERVIARRSDRLDSLIVPRQDPSYEALVHMYKEEDILHALIESSKHIQREPDDNPFRGFRPDDFEDIEASYREKYPDFDEPEFTRFENSGDVLRAGFLIRHRIFSFPGGLLEKEEYRFSLPVLLEVLLDNFEWFSNWLMYKFFPNTFPSGADREPNSWSEEWDEVSMPVLGLSCLSGLGVIQDFVQLRPPDVWYGPGTSVNAWVHTFVAKHPLKPQKASPREIDTVDQVLHTDYMLAGRSFYWEIPLHVSPRFRDVCGWKGALLDFFHVQSKTLPQSQDDYSLFKELKRTLAAATGPPTSNAEATTVR